MRISKTTIIEAPASLVFEILMDVDLATVWVPMLTSYKLVSETPNKVGSIYESQYNQNNMRFKQTAEITAYVKNLSVGWRAKTPFYKAQVDYFLTEISDSATELSHVSEYQYHGFSKIWAWMSKSKIRECSEDILDEAHRNFKSLVEMTYWSGDR